MSTRSGKRIHGSLHENMMKADLEPAVKSERKTRSKRAKENGDALSVGLFQVKKRNNYVSYPTDDEQNGDEAIKKNKEARQGRTLRRNTLKEQNIVVQNSDSIDTLPEPENLTRKSRRGKKNGEEQAENLENVQNQVEKPKSKKNKKKAEVMTVDEGTVPVLAKMPKKKKKKSKQSNSMVVEVINQDGNSRNNTFNKSMSMESFHSAAGSPSNVCEDEEPALLGFAEDTTLDNSIINTTLNQRKSDIKDITDKHEAMLIDADTTLKAINIRKSIQQDKTFGKNSMSIVNSTKTFETDGDTDSITSDNSNNEFAKRKPHINNGTFDKSTKIIDTTFEKESENDKKDSTYDKAFNKTVDTTFDKDTGSSATPKKKKLSIKDTTFDKNEKVDDKIFEKDMVPTPQKSAKKVVRKSNIKDTTLGKIEDTTFEKKNSPPRSAKKSSIRKSSIKKSTLDKNENVGDTTFENETVTTPQKSGKNSLRKSNVKDTTFDKIEDTMFEKEISPLRSAKKCSMSKSSIKNSTFDKNDNIDDTTFEKDTIPSLQNSAVKKSLEESNTKDTDNVESTAEKITTRKSIKDTTIEKRNNSETPNAAKKRKSDRFDTYRNESIENNDSTFNKDLNTELEGAIQRKSQQNGLKLSINEQGRSLNSTYEKNSKASLISSDNSEMEKSNISCISITSDESENLANTTPVLIESSMDNSCTSKHESPAPQTPLKREGTFTKEGPEVLQEIPPEESLLPLAGCTPYHVAKSSQKRVLNVTRSVEKRRLSMEPAPRMTRVMFCSPVDNPLASAHEKRKIIKSNLKGSNKSFVFEDSVSVAAGGARPARKRSRTHGEAEHAAAKRTRLAAPLQHSVDRLSRPRTSSAAAKLTDPTTPSKPVTPSKSKSDAKSTRTKLPNFAALHQRQFSKMESLGECQQRRAKRARQLLTPNGAVDMLERISPKGTDTEPQKPKEQAKKTDTPTKLPTLESLRPGFTRFGFKLNLDVNPFSVPSKHPAPKPNVAKPALPSLAGATSVRREVAKQAVMREKSFTDRKNLVNRGENRTIIKGVRTNRRFELQMKLRNVE